MNNTFFVIKFNESRRDKIWFKDEIPMKASLRFKLTLLEMIDNLPEFIVPDKYLEGEFYRLSLGYRGIGKNSGFVSGIQSKDSIGLPPNLITKDHLVGSTEVGRYIHKVFKESNYNIDWMVDEWLYEHLFLWATVKLTKKEHHKDNVLRNSSHTIEQKLNMEHYIDVSELI